MQHDRAISLFDGAVCLMYRLNIDDPIAVRRIGIQGIGNGTREGRSITEIPNVG